MLRAVFDLLQPRYTLGSNNPRAASAGRSCPGRERSRRFFASLDSRNKPHEPHAQDRSHPFDHGGRQVERRYRRERRCLVDLTTDLHVETSTVEKGCEIVAVLERRSIELTLGEPGDGLPEPDPLGWQVANLRLEREIWNNPPAACELAEQAMNVPGETTCLLSREIADEPFAQDHQRSTTVETRGGDLQLDRASSPRHRVDLSRRSEASQSA